MTTGIELRDEGIANVIAADVAPHKMAGKFIKATIAEYAESGREFTADDVREALKDNPTVVRELAAKPNLLPAHMGAASQAGLIHAVGMYRPSRASRRASRNLVWIGGEAAWPPTSPSTAGHASPKNPPSGTRSPALSATT